MPSLCIGIAVRDLKTPGLLKALASCANGASHFEGASPALPSKLPRTLSTDKEIITKDSLLNQVRGELGYFFSPSNNLVFFFITGFFFYQVRGEFGFVFLPSKNYDFVYAGFFFSKKFFQVKGWIDLSLGFFFQRNSIKDSIKYIHWFHKINSGIP